MDDQKTTILAAAMSNDKASVPDYYSDGYDTDGFRDKDAADDCFLEEKDDDLSTDFRRTNCKILSELDIHQRVEDAIVEVSTVLSLSKGEAGILLGHFNWSVSKIHDAWFSDEPGVREKVGLLHKSIITSDDDDDDDIIIICGICFESFPRDKFLSAYCCHVYCRTCWFGYVSSSINDDGAGCLKLKCPEPSCRAAVGRDLVESLVFEKKKNKYFEFLIRSYVDDNRKLRWCPSPGCDCAIEFLGGGEGGFDVTCHCLNCFCLNCGEETHHPLDCEAMKKWISKVLSESENLNYILSYCKPCPNCRRPIEKDGGCMHMTCKICHHPFCWLCLSSEYNHNCNAFQENKKESSRQEMALRSLEKYTHYFERWDANRLSKLKALSDYKEVKNVQLRRLSEELGVPEVHLEFITKAWEQIVECRRVLEWSYAYGYYMPEFETAKKVFFEYLQGEAESTLEKLHHLAESELNRYLCASRLSMNFTESRTMLVGLTKVTGNYFDNLVKALENGLADVVSHKPSSSDVDPEDNLWECDRCTFANPPSVKACLMCVFPDE